MEGSGVGTVGNAKEFYHLLTVGPSLVSSLFRCGGFMTCSQFTIHHNFATNLFSLYDPSEPDLSDSPELSVAHLGVAVLVRTTIVIWGK